MRQRLLRNDHVSFNSAEAGCTTWPLQQRKGPCRHNSPSPSMTHRCCRRRRRAGACAPPQYERPAAGHTLVHHSCRVPAGCSEQSLRPLRQQADAERQHLKSGQQALQLLCRAAGTVFDRRPMQACRTATACFYCTCCCCGAQQQHPGPSCPCVQHQRALAHCKHPPPRTRAGTGSWQRARRMWVQTGWPAGRSTQGWRRRGCRAPETAAAEAHRGGKRRRRGNNCVAARLPAALLGLAPQLSAWRLA